MNTAKPTRRCVVCLAPATKSASAMYCDAHRVEARRAAAREYQRRKRGYKGVWA